MPAMAVTSTPTEVPVEGPGLLTLQNSAASADSVFFGHASDVDETTGLEIVPGDSYEYAREGFGGVFVMSTGTADLRWMSY